MTDTLKERLYAKLPERPEDGCWLFAGARNRAGYGNLYIRSEGSRATTRRTVTDCAHRVAWQIHFGPVPEGRHVLHRCDNPPCCNPAHLFLGDQAANMRDKSEKGRAKPGPVADPAWWTPERKAVRAAQKTEWERLERDRLRREAGAPAGTKQCGCCRKWLPLRAFHANRAKGDGRHGSCKTCRSTVAHPT